MKKELFLYQFIKAYNLIEHQQDKISAKIYFQEKIENGLYIYFLRNIIIHEFTHDIDFDYIDEFIGFENIMSLFNTPANYKLKDKLDGYIIDRFGRNFLDSGYKLTSYKNETIQVLYEKNTRFKGLTKKILISDNYKNITYTISNYSYEKEMFKQVMRNPDIHDIFLKNNDLIVMNFDPIKSTFNINLNIYLNSTKAIKLKINSDDNNWIIDIPNETSYDIAFTNLNLTRVTHLEKVKDNITFWKIFRYYFNDIYDLIRYLMREIKRFENEILNNYKTNKVKELYD